MKKHLLILAINFLALALSGDRVRGDDAPLAAALKKASQDGRPVLAVCGRNTCPRCAAFGQFLSNETALRPLLANYVVVKVDVDSRASGYNELALRHPLKGTLLPFVYVLRADGDVIHGAAAVDPDGAAAQMIRDGLAKAGRPLGAKDAARYATALEKAEEAWEQNNAAQALSLVAPAMKAQSFAAPIAQSHKLVEKITKKADEDVAECERLLEDADKLLSVAVLASDAGRQYTKLPTQKKALNQISSKIQKKEGGSVALAQAQEIVKARGYARAGNNDRAVDVYKKLVEKHPGTPVAELADAEMKVLANKPVGAEKGGSAKEGKRTARANP